MNPTRFPQVMAILVALLTTLAGCATQQQRTVQPPSPSWNKPSTAMAYVGGESGQRAEPAPAEDATGIRIDGEEESPEDEDPIKEEVIQIGSSDLFNRQAASRSLPVPPVDGEVSFNFQDQPIQAVAQAIIGDFYGENYIIAPGVGGTVTYVTQKPIRAEQAMSVLEYLLALNNASIVFKDGRYEILPVTAAVPGNISPRLGPIPTGRGYQVQIVPLTYIAPSEMQRLLTPFARPNAIVSADNSRGIMVLAGTREELQNYLRTVEIFDVDWLKGMSIGFYPLQNAEIAEVMPELEKLFVDPNGSPLAGMFRFLPIERLNGVFVITQNPDYLQEAREWLKRLDRTDASVAGTQLYVYNVKNIKAVDLADYLGAIFTGGGTPSGPSERRAPRANVAPGQEAVEVSSQGAAGEPRSRRRQQSAAAGGGVTTAGDEDISFTAVEENNQLLIRSTSSEYETIMSTIRKLDIEPLQVHVEMQIIEVGLTDNFEFGVQWFLEGLLGQGLDPNPDVGWHQPGNQQRWAFGGNNASPIAAAGSFFYRFTSNELDVAIKALQDVAETRILSAPSLTVLNNQEANINIGDQIPIVTTYFSGGFNSTGQNTNPYNTSNVQYRDTGVILSVTPRVNPGGLVYLELEQEVSKPGTRDTVSNNFPINKRSVNTQIAVQSGETVLLGGFISEDNTASEVGVPGLSKIPVLGRLFGKTVDNKRRTELVVLITPRVIQTVIDARQLTREYQENFRQLKPLDLRTGQPFSDEMPARTPSLPEEERHDD
jgi:general secretion pathway protein D